MAYRKSFVLIYISIVTNLTQSTEKNITETTEIIENKTEATTTEESTSANNGLSEDFKKAMDSYEEFMNEYVEFMKKYNENATDLTLISQYATMMKKYSEQISAFDKWESEDMTTEEATYYVDVQARVSKKLLEVAN